MLDTDSLQLLVKQLARLDRGFEKLPGFEPQSDLAAIDSVLGDVSDRLRDNFPYFHPFYAGQMLKPPHPVARLAYSLAMYLNPNNHALDGGRASSAMEKEAVAELAKMYGWQTHLGHLTSGGTMANLEALWVAGKLHPGKRILGSAQAHYTHSRISEVLKLSFAPIATDSHARMDVDALRGELGQGDVGTVVVTLGTTGVGAVDPLPEILALREEFQFRIHIDSAYGGYFGLVDNLAPAARAAYGHVNEADSLVVDPHKHGLQPYGCGCILFRDPAVGSFYRHDSPYTYFSSADLHLGEISLECSRAGATAVALWATQRLLPPVRGGEFARGLAGCRAAAVALFAWLQSHSRFITLMEPELDIVVWACNATTASEISRRSQALFDAAAERELHLALIELPAELLQQYWPHVEFDQPGATCLRSCLMKPEHEAWLPQIQAVLDAVAIE